MFVCFLFLFPLTSPLSSRFLCHTQPLNTRIFLPSLESILPSTLLHQPCGKEKKEEPQTVLTLLFRFHPYIFSCVSSSSLTPHHTLYYFADCLPSGRGYRRHVARPRELQQPLRYVSTHHPTFLTPPFQLPPTQDSNYSQHL